jgi:hypothetical protein
LFREKRKIEKTKPELKNPDNQVRVEPTLEEEYIKTQEKMLELERRLGKKGYR